MGVLNLAVVRPNQRTNIGAAGYACVDETDITDRAAGRTKQTDVMRTSPADRQRRDRMAQAVEGAGEAAFVIA